MVGNSDNRVDCSRRFEGQATRLANPEEGVFSNLTRIESLHAAYSHLIGANAQDSSVDRLEPPPASDNVNGFLDQLSEDLRAGRFRAERANSSASADEVSVNDASIQLRTRIVQMAVCHALERVFPTNAPADFIACTVTHINQGLSRIYAVTIEENGASRSEHILATVRQHVADATFLELLAEVLKSIGSGVTAGPNPLGCLLTRIALHSVDQVLLQANLLGRQGSSVHATCVRFDHEVALFLDHDAQYEWLLPAVQKRLREALAEIKAEADPEQTQLVDLAQGGKLRLLDHEFRFMKNRGGTACVEYSRLEKLPEPKPEAQKPDRERWKIRLPKWPRRARRNPTAPAEPPSGRGFHWPSLRLHWPRGIWDWSPNVPGGIYAVAGGVLIVALLVAGTAFGVAYFWGGGPELYPVRGQVFFEGEPAVGALVIFVPKDTKSSQAQLASALVAEDGTYGMGTHRAKDGALAGEYVVTIWRRPGREGKMLAARYGSRQTTPLTATVKMGPTEVPAFQLQAESR